MDRRGLGIRLLLAGAAIEVIGVAIEVWQEQNVYTISQSVTLPTFLVMVLGIPLISRGYGRCLWTTGPARRVYVVASGSMAGLLFLLGALWWQLSVGLPSGSDFDLESYSASVLFFVGVALVARGIASLSYGLHSPNDRNSTGLATTGPATEKSSGPLNRRPWSLAPLLAAGITFLGVTISGAGWLEQQVLNVNSLYLIVALELSGSGAWFLLVGYFGLLRGLSSPPSRLTRIGGMVFGTALIAGGIVRWWSTLLTGWVSVIGVVAFALSGAGLLILSVLQSEGSTLQGADKANGTP